MAFSSLKTLWNHPNTHLSSVAMEEQVVSSETVLGFRLPNPLRRFYKEVGNGGFIVGGADLYGVQGGYDYDGEWIEDFYRKDTDDTLWNSEQGGMTFFLYKGEVIQKWPEKLLGIGLWRPAAGVCSLYLDCNAEEMPVYFFDVSGFDWSDAGVPAPIVFLYPSLMEYLLALQRDAETGKREAYAYVSARFREDMDISSQKRVPIPRERRTNPALPPAPEMSVEELSAGLSDPFDP